MRISKTLFIFATAVAFLIVPTCAYACEPVPQLLYIFIGPSIWGAAMAAQASVALLAVVFVKSILFAYKNGQNRLSSFVLMLFANVYSTIPGLVGLIIVSIPSALLVSIPILYFMYYGMSNYLLITIQGKKQLPDNSFFNSRNGVSGVLLAATILSTLFFFLSQGFQGNNLLLYWMAKVVFTTLAVSIGLAISISCEGAFITWTRKVATKNEESCGEAVVWANVWGAFISVGLAAAVMLPQRFESRNFLVLVERALRSVFS